MEKEVKKVSDYISIIFNIFNVYKNLKKSENNTVYNINKYFWWATFVSLENALFLRLSKIFEKRGKNDVLSIYYLLSLLPEGTEKNNIQKEIRSHDDTVKKLIIWRNNIFAHDNINFALDNKEFFKKFPIKGEEIENILDLLEKIIGMIDSARTKTGQAYSFRLIEGESREDTERVVRYLKTAQDLEEEQRKH